MIIDIHCDLLSHPHFSPRDPNVRCSPGQLFVGGIRKQVCAIFVAKSQKTPSCDEQNALFFSLPQEDPRITCITHNKEHNTVSLTKKEPSLAIIRSIENASVLGNDSQPLHELFIKLVALTKEGPLAYLGIVWNEENRFGGGAFAPNKLSQEGKYLLDLMDQLAIPIDLSHCCDRLTEDILDYTANKLPNLPILASHSNFRAILDHPRNLMDVHAKEIAHRGGVIGLNLIRPFVGPSLDAIQDHILHAEKIEVLFNLVLGTDFFYSNATEKFFDNFKSAADHPTLHQIIRHSCSEEQAKSILASRAEQFLQRVIAKQAGKQEFTYIDL
ncbi:membrane dipeptidase [Candidatus Chlamydia sanziniae]|uniref:Microsomal dipeptidase n=1 Tax=Candidatus Chlamydia sanziniae TaxID=1806891 RepID=A0A1A9HW00_9CHLA|nr:membrane dipeptidase [Candidatus Chlamydia sanziniae]ANH79015.1 Microsomal dipeptidase [Candidatus Chlamydia sanziniae]